MEREALTETTPSVKWKRPVVVRDLLVEYDGVWEKSDEEARSSKRKSCHFE